MNTRFIISLPLILLPPVHLAAQNNLNQTVQVTNVYEGGTISAEREFNSLTVPDSLKTFDLKFTYTGFETPYKGSSEFNPFYTDLEIAPRASNSGKLYLKAGAGYTLAPVLDFSCNLVDKPIFKMGTHVSHDSYWGRYHGISYSDAPAGILIPVGDAVKGFDSRSSAGFDWRVDCPKVNLMMTVGYEGIHNDIPLLTSKTRRLYNGADVRIQINSNLDRRSARVYYGVRLGYSFGSDDCDGPLAGGRSLFYENAADASFRLGVTLGKKSALEVGASCNFKTGFSKYSLADYLGYSVFLDPKYCLNTDNFHLGIGAGILISDAKANGVQVLNNGNFDVRPTLKLSWAAVHKVLDVYADAGYSGTLQGVRDKALAYGFFLPEREMAVAKNFLVDMGFRGNIVEMFHYNVCAGFEEGRNLSAIKVFGDPQPHRGGNRPEIIHQDMNDFFGALELKAIFYGITLRGDVKYRAFLKKDALAVVPPGWTAGFDIRYDYMKRFAIYAGTSYQSESRSGGFTVPGFVELHAGMNYFFSMKTAVFLEGANLLDNLYACQYIPLVARKGISITGGIILNF